MGLYVNSRKPQNNFQETVNSVYFVDKTGLLEELIPIVGPGTRAGNQNGLMAGQGNKYICITRPRRFGKTVAANMIAAYFGKGYDGHQIFDGLKIHACEQYEAHLNQHNVVYITFSEMPGGCGTYEQYILRIQKRILADLMRAYPNACIEENDTLWDAFNNIYELEEEVKFIFVLDEWDFIFHRGFVTDQDKKAYLSFLSSLLKDQPYVELAYMTGILPIAKYSSGSELNMFFEYTMASEEKYCAYFGFSEAEVDGLYKIYLEQTAHPKVTREGLRIWYNGYHTMSGGKVYNPRSVAAALTNNNLGSYWTSSGPYDEIFYYVGKNVDDVRDALALMVSGVPVRTRVREYAASSMGLATKEEILSAMVVYGFLSCEQGNVFIPNKELMDQFEEMLRKEPSLGYVYRLAKASDRMLEATISGTRTPCVLFWNMRTIQRFRCSATAMKQIKDRGYALRFRGKLAEEREYQGRILAVGIAYDKEYKKHSCKIEVLEERIQNE